MQGARGGAARNAASDVLAIYFHAGSRDARHQAESVRTFFEDCVLTIQGGKSPLLITAIQIRRGIR